MSCLFFFQVVRTQPFAERLIVFLIEDDLVIFFSKIRVKGDLRTNSSSNLLDKAFLCSGTD